MNIQVYYNNTSLSTLGTVPFVSRKMTPLRAGEAFGREEEFVLKGQITGNCVDGFTQIVTKQREFLDIFSKGFKSFKIEQDGSGIYSYPCVKVKNINFTESPWNRLLGYTVNLGVYDSGHCLYNGILDPSEEISYAEDEESRVISITHNISCRGINTNSSSSNAVQNALNFISSRSGIISVAPAFLSTGSGEPVLRSVSQEVNRFNGAVSLTETYGLDSSSTGNYIHRYNLSSESGMIEGETKVSINGNIEGSKGSSIESLREIYGTFDIYAISNSFCSGLNPQFLSSGVNEEPFSPKINYNASFTTNPSIVEIDAEGSLKTNELTKVSEFGLSVSFKTFGDLSLRESRINSAISGYDFSSKASGIYDLYGLSYSLNLNAVGSGKAVNPYTKDTTITLNYNNKDIPEEPLKMINYDINYSPGLKKYGINPLVNLDSMAMVQEYVVFDLGYTGRSSLSVNIDGIVESGKYVLGLEALESQVSGYKNSFPFSGVDEVLKEYQLSSGEVGRVSVKKTWTYQE